MIVTKEELSEDIENLKGTMRNITEYNKKYHPEKTFDLTDVIQYALPYTEHIHPYHPRAVAMTILIQEVLLNPDPLALLEAWRGWRENNTNDSWSYRVCGAWMDEDDFIQNLRTNPEAVRQQGIKEGWWKE